MVSEKGKSFQLYNIELLVFKEGFEADSTTGDFLFSFWVGSTRTLDAIVSALFCLYRIFSKCKEGIPKFSVYVARRTSHSARLSFLLAALLFLWLLSWWEGGVNFTY